MAKPLEFENHPWSYSKNPPTYRGVCRAVTDGDTYDVFFDLGFRKYAFETIRLQGLDTPEIFHPSNDAELTHGRAAKARAIKLILNKPIRLTTYHDTVTYGRFVADIYYLNGKGVWTSLADTLRAEGYAKKDSYE